MTDHFEEAQRQERLGFPPYILYREAQASANLDRDETHVVGEVTVDVSPDTTKLDAAFNKLDEAFQRTLGVPVKDVHWSETRAYEEAREEELYDAAALILSSVAGLDINSPHGRETPARYIRMLRELTTPEPFSFTTFPAESQNMVTIRDITFSSVCSHHVIPFMGAAHVGYIPDKKLCGLSKVARLVRAEAAKLQVQENLTSDIANILNGLLEPLGVAVVMEAEHLCMSIRGVQAPGARTRTAEMLGVFADHSKTAKAEFLSAINGGK